MNKVKYERRKRKERANHLEREARLRDFERAHQKRIAYWRKMEELRKLHDPKHPLYQELVNILYTHLCNDPLYRLTEIARAVGIDMQSFPILVF